MDNARDFNFGEFWGESHQFDNSTEEANWWNNALGGAKQNGDTIRKKVEKYVRSRKINCVEACIEDIIDETILRLNEKLIEDKDSIEHPITYSKWIAKDVIKEHHKECLTYNNKINTSRVENSGDSLEEDSLEKELFKCLNKYPQIEQKYILAQLIKDFQFQVNHWEYQVFKWWQISGYTDREIWNHLRIDEPLLTFDAFRQRKSRIGKLFKEFYNGNLPPP